MSRLTWIACAATFAATLLPSLPAPAQQAPGDPPARAGRIAQVSGEVSFHGAGAEQWTPATLNFPLTGGDGLWTAPQGSATVEVSASRIVLDGGTELDIDALDALTMTMTAAQGELFLRLGALAPGEGYGVRLAGGSASFAAPGRYAVAAGDDRTPGSVTVFNGVAEVDGPDFALLIRGGQKVTLGGGEAGGPSIGPAAPDAFLAALLDEPPVSPPAGAGMAAPPPFVAEMPGGSDLQAYGVWQPTPQYGPVWYPQVAPGWVPYRDGHWAYVAPWGWTWVDAAPWGFAPFHYGRWVQIDDRWCWAPSYAAPGFVPPPFYRPVYAPALVSFFGVGVGVGLAAGPSVGWVPLGWGEPYRPWYRHSGIYDREINRAYVRNPTAIPTERNRPVESFANRRAATMVPAAAMTTSRPIGTLARPVPAARFATLHAAAAVPVQPTRQTAGVTPVVVRQLRLPPAAPGAPARPVAAGPAIGPGVRPGVLRAARPPGAVPQVERVAPAPASLRAPAPEQPARPMTPAAPPRPVMPQMEREPPHAAPPPPHPVPQVEREPPHVAPAPHPIPQVERQVPHIAPAPHPAAQLEREPQHVNAPPPRPEPRPTPREPEKRCNPGQPC